jgi:hypothetical protein
MSKRILAGWVVMVFLALYVASQAKLAAQTLECPAESSGALMQADYPAYRDATELARTLIGSGFIVKCITRSTFEGISGEKGAALYLTNYGDFDVIFLPRPQTFDALKVIERHKEWGYEYMFRGSPRPASRMSGRQQRTYFLKHSNQLFIVWDKQTATSLAKALNSR